jgi:filamentous hemagglutinin family protein
MKHTPTNDRERFVQYSGHMPGTVPYAFNRLTAALCRCFSRQTGYLTGTAVLMSPGLVFGGPNGEQVVAGNVNITRPDANTTEITQGSPKAIVNWQQFSIGREEYVQFKQPGSNAIALNRVVGQDPSTILGRMDANGRVFLVNPRGVYFGPSARVDVGGLVASVHDIADQDFLDGNYIFSSAGGNDAAVVNEGVIRAADGGYVALIGERVRNEGLIQARLGTAVLASGRQTTLTLDESGGLVDFAVDEAALSAAAGVVNTGEIIADGGRVLLTAKLASDLAATAVNNQGLVQAHSIEQREGRVFLRGAGGDVVNEGTIDASGEGNQAGGVVIITADRNVDLRPDSRIDTSGAGQGDGGMVRVIADGTLNFQKDATVAASAGDAASPDPQAEAGFIELSGHEDFTIAGEIGLDGPGGSLLFDPPTLTITNDLALSSPSGGVVTRGFLQNTLAGGTNLILVASNSFAAAAGPSGGAIFVVNGQSGGTGGGLSLRIGSNPSFASSGGSLGYGFGCSFTGVCVPGTSFQSFPTSGRAINLGGVDFLLDGAFSATALDGSIALRNVTANGVAIEAGFSGGIAVNNINGGPSILLLGNSIAVAGAAMAGGISIGLRGPNGSLTAGLLESIPPAKPAAVTVNYLGANTNININTNTPTVNIGGSGSVASLIVNNNNGTPFSNEIVNLLDGDGPPSFQSVTVLFNGNGMVNVQSPTAFMPTFLDLRSVNGNLTFNNSFMLPSNALTFLQASGNVNLSNANLTTGALEVAAGNNIISNSGTILNITGNALLQGGDSAVFAELDSLGIVHASGPTGIFKGININIQGLSLGTGMPQYLIFDPAQLTIAPVSPVGNLLVQLLGASPGDAIGVESSSLTGTNCGGASCAANFFGDSVFNAFPNSSIVTFAVGGGVQTGNIFIGQNGIVDLGARNLVMITTGGVDNPANVTTTGFVSTIGTIVTTPPSSGGGTIVDGGLKEFVTPTVGEFEDDESDDDEDLVLDGEGGEGGELVGFEEQTLSCG